MTWCIHMSLTIPCPRDLSPIIVTHTHNIAYPHVELLEGPPVAASINDKSRNLRPLIWDIYRMSRLLAACCLSVWHAFIELAKWSARRNLKEARCRFGPRWSSLVTFNVSDSEVGVEPKIPAAIISHQAAVIEVNVDTSKYVGDSQPTNRQDCIWRLTQNNSSWNANSHVFSVAHSRCWHYIEMYKFSVLRVIFFSAWRVLDWVTGSWVFLSTRHPAVAT